MALKKHQINDLVLTSLENINLSITATRLIFFQTITFLKIYVQSFLTILPFFQVLPS